MTRRSKQTKKRSKQTKRRKRVRRRRDWRSLPLELLELIARKLNDNICDHIRFRSVCLTWRHAAASMMSDTDHQWIPWLFFPFGVYDDTIPFFNPADRRIYQLPYPKKAQGMFAHGSSYGWLVMLGSKYGSQSVSLFNPITQAHIILPPYPCCGVGSTLLCCNPTTPPKQPRQLMLAIKSGSAELHISRHGDDRWYVIEKPAEFSRDSKIQYIKEKDALYAVDAFGRIAVLDLASSTLRLLINTPSPEIQSLPEIACWNFVATATGDMLFFVWDLSELIRPRFAIFKLNKIGEEGRLNWTRAADIGGSMLFQSHREIFEVCNPESIDCRANEIYCVRGRLHQDIKHYATIDVSGRVWNIVTPAKKIPCPIFKFSKGYTPRGIIENIFTWMTPILS